MRVFFWKQFILNFSKTLRLLNILCSLISQYGQIRHIFKSIWLIFDFNLFNLVNDDALCHHSMHCCKNIDKILPHLLDLMELRCSYLYFRYNFEFIINEFKGFKQKQIHWHLILSDQGHHKDSGFLASKCGSSRLQTAW